MYQLRPYQRDAVLAALRTIEPNTLDPLDPSPATLICCPTGCGKSLILGEIVRQLITHIPGYRIMMLTHVKTLVAQNHEKLINLCPDLTGSVGVHSAGLNRRDTHHPIIFGNVQSVINTLKKDQIAFGERNTLIVDECHLISPVETTSYQIVINILKSINPNLKIIGLTATPFRLKSGHLLDDIGNRIFTSIAFDNTKLDDFNDLIKQGYLAPLIPKQTETEIDLSAVHIQNGDYKKDELQRAAMAGTTTERAIDEMLDNAGDRKKWLIFASGIEHTEQIAEILQSKGINALYAHSEQDRKINDQVIKEFKEHPHLPESEPIALVGADMFTTGFDCPDIDLIGMLRPTTSVGLHCQMLGRGTRPHPAKKNCIVFDYAYNTARLGPINDPVIKARNKKRQQGDMPVKVCPECMVYNHPKIKICINCGYEFPVHEKIVETASTHQIIKDPDQVHTLTVNRVTYNLHEKKDKPPSVRVSYFCGLRMVDEWVCPEHPNVHARIRAFRWVEDRLTDGSIAPRNTNDILKISNK